jgi:uncharacterized protein (DUF433 family)
MNARVGILYWSKRPTPTFRQPLPVSESSKPVVTKASPIVQTPGILGGAPRIAGRRIGVQHIAVWHEQMGMSDDEIMREFSLTPHELTAALDYYRTHREEIDNAIEENEKIATEMQQRYPSKLQAKLKAQRSG